MKVKAFKFMVALAGAGIIALQSALTDDHITRGEWVAIAVAIATAAGVWAMPNPPRDTPPVADGRIGRTYTE